MNVIKRYLKENIGDNRAILWQMYVSIWFNLQFVKDNMFQENRCSHFKQSNFESFEHSLISVQLKVYYHILFRNIKWFPYNKNSYLKQRPHMLLLLNIF